MLGRDTQQRSQENPPELPRSPIPGHAAGTEGRPALSAQPPTAAESVRDGGKVQQQRTSVRACVTYVQTETGRYCAFVIHRDQA